MSVENKAEAEVIFKYCAPFTNCKSEISYTRIDNARYINV